MRDALVIACETDDDVTFRKFLADEHFNPTCRGNLAIRWATDHGSTKIVKLILLDGRVHPDVEYGYAISNAAYYGHTEIVKLFLADSRTTTLTKHNDNPICVATQLGHTEVVKLLLKDPRVNPNHCFKQAIRGAVLHGRIEAVLLIEADWRVNAFLRKLF